MEFRSFAPFLISVFFFRMYVLNYIFFNYFKNNYFVCVCVCMWVYICECIYVHMHICSPVDVNRKLVGGSQFLPSTCCCCAAYSWPASGQSVSSACQLPVSSSPWITDYRCDTFRGIKCGSSGCGAAADDHLLSCLFAFYTFCEVSCQIHHLLVCFSFV